jgi:hypothetical protein
MTNGTRESAMNKDQTQHCTKLRETSNLRSKLLQKNLRAAKRTHGLTLTPRMISHLKTLSRVYGFSVEAGELQVIDGNWYVTHTGLLRLARRKRCRGIHVEAVDSLCDSAANRFVLKATVYPSKDSAGFVGYGDADPSNVSLLVRGVEMRIAETRGVNRALPSLLIPFPLWFAFLAWRPQAIGVLIRCQGTLEKELDLLIRRAVLPFCEFSDPRFQVGWYSDKQGHAGFVHLQITRNFSCSNDIVAISFRYQEGAYVFQKSPKEQPPANTPQRFPSQEALPQHQPSTAPSAKRADQTIQLLLREWGCDPA